MKPILKSTAYFLVIGIIFFSSCKKEKQSAVSAPSSPSSPRAANQPPSANAGSDHVITLPTDSVWLDGTRSFDPDTKIASYLWTKISGPSIFNITNVNTVRALVTDLVQGIYKFELRVTDSSGLSTASVVQVTVLASSKCPN